MQARIEAQCVLPEIDALFAQSKEVSIGTLVASAPTGIVGSHVTVEIGTFRRDRAWKGGLGRSVRIGFDTTVPVRIGEQYLIFATGDTQPLDGSCYRVQLLDTPRAIEQVRSVHRHETLQFLE
jgi:hypothetical protein